MSSGSILRGHLRPVGARGPPFLIILLLIIIFILGFNYWNLSSEYDTILKETADLQDHLRIAVLKKENAERQYEAFEKRYRETEAQLGKMKIAADQKEHEISKASERLDLRMEEVKKMKSQLTSCQAINAKLEVTSGLVEDLQKKVSLLEDQKISLFEENKKVLKTVDALRFKLGEMELQQSSMHLMQNQQAAYPFLIRSKPTNAKQPPGHLKPLKPRSVRVIPKGMNGITVYFGGPLMPNFPDDEPNVSSNDGPKYQQSKERDLNNEANVLPAPGNPPISQEEHQKRVNQNAGVGVLPLPETPNKDQDNVVDQTHQLDSKLNKTGGDAVDNQSYQAKEPAPEPDNVNNVEGEKQDRIENYAVEHKENNVSDANNKSKTEVVGSTLEEKGETFLKNSVDYKNEDENPDLKLNVTESIAKPNEEENGLKDDSFQNNSDKLVSQTLKPGISVTSKSLSQ